MNPFRTTCFYSLLTAFLVIFLWTGIFCTPAVSGQDLEPSLISDSEGPIHQHNSFLFADIDTLKQQVYLFIDSGLWKFDLENQQWQFLDSLENWPDDIEHYEFGYNAPKQKLQLWSHGVGRMYDISLSDYSTERIDNSHNHRNQFGHAPFFHKSGSLFAFGGYGYWNWKNIIIFYNETISEWNIQPVRPSSELPAPRKPLSGAYSSADDKFYSWEEITRKTADRMINIRKLTRTLITGLLISTISDGSKLPAMTGRTLISLSPRS